MIVTCPQCQKKLHVDDALAGQEVRCPGCQTAFTATAASPAETYATDTPAAAPAPAPQPVPLTPAPTYRRPSRSASGGPGGIDVALGKIGVALGLVLVLLARGCDSVGNRSVARAHAKKEEARLEMPKSSERTKADRERLEELDEEVDEARIDNTLLGYWREWLFVIGSIILSLGLLHVGFGGTGAERIICLIMLAIITFSIYVGGVPWISSLNIPGMH